MMKTGQLTPAEASDFFRQEPQRFLDVGAGEAAYRKIGTGPDVLFVHGWPVSGATFRTLLPHLVDHVTCHIIDFPGAGSSRFDGSTDVTIARHISTVRKVVDLLGLESVSVIGHDSGGMIARHAMAGDSRLRSMGLIDTEQPQGLTLRFKSFILGGHAPGFGNIFGWIAGQKRLRRNKLVLGAAFENTSLLDGDFDEFFLQPIHEIAARRDASVRTLKSFDVRYVNELAAIHQRITVPVHLVWGERDPFFPIEWARGMVSTFPNAKLTEIAGAGLFVHEERPAEVAAALLPTLL